MAKTVNIPNNDEFVFLKLEIGGAEYVKYKMQFFDPIGENLGLVVEGDNTHPPPIIMLPIPASQLDRHYESIRIDRTNASMEDENFTYKVRVFLGELNSGVAEIDKIEMPPEKKTDQSADDYVAFAHST